MDTERKIYGLLETVEQQQKSLSIAAQALDQTRQAIGLLVDEVKEASAAGASAGAAQALENAGMLVADAAGPTIAELKRVAARIGRAILTPAGGNVCHVAIALDGRRRVRELGDRRVGGGRLAAKRALRTSGSKERARGADRHHAGDGG